MDTITNPIEQNNRPEGLSDAEWNLIKEHREREAEEQRHIQAWKAVILEFESAAKPYDAEDLDAWGWGACSCLFLARAAEAGWNKEHVARLVEALLPKVGYVRQDVRGRGAGWFWKEIR
jgi:hypothetical protein